jgi:hypothetical protein
MADMSDRSSPRYVSLMTQNDWNEAVAGGTLTLDDVIERLSISSMGNLLGPRRADREPTFRAADP